MAARRKVGKARKKVGKRKKKTAARKVRTLTAAPATIEYRTRELDPLRKCGPRTSVERLIRVDEHEGTRHNVHLVFYDQRGWYCEHGRECPAVKAARRLAGAGPGR